jgi:uncharacterized protein (DUF2236 family)
MPIPSLLVAALEGPVDRLGRRFIEPAGAPAFDFALPPGEPAILPPQSLSWRIFRNPVTLFIGGVAAVVLELAEPSVRSGVWQHSGFRADPVGRMRRTGVAAMVSVYGARSRAEATIAAVVRRHATVTGTTPDGTPYRANDPALLDWVQATATFGFATAYARYAAPLGEAQLSQAFQEAHPLGALYGARDMPASLAGWQAMLAETLPRLQPSGIVLEFLDMMARADALPSPLRPLQPPMVRGAVAVLPAPVRQRLGLGERFDLRPGEARLLAGLGALADRLVLRSLPPARSCARLGLPEDHLCRTARGTAAAPAGRAA